ncbi:PAS domain-containing protein [Clostridium sp. OS1-26]|uniref:PAS domain-containing protein n=1 Tax=Clostridium sp. OS1-26 TaxID=3070681 RepID=UPI0027DF06E7|nr:PAS domain-containing protein [Clostridium sp. OS1-26]WML33132.1 PAS domain-containing protein [Clostridium sp. OS1-26]
MFYKEINPKEENVDNSKEFNSLFNALDEYVLVVDEKGTILNANKSALLRLGYTSEEIYGMSLSHLYLSKSIDEIREIIKNMLEGRISKFKMQLCTKSRIQIAIEACVFIGKWNEKIAIYAICKEFSEASEINVPLKIANYN